MLTDLNDTLYLSKDDDVFVWEILNNNVTCISDAQSQHSQAYSKLFGGSLGVYPDQKVKIDFLSG